METDRSEDRPGGAARGTDGRGGSRPRRGRRRPGAWRLAGWAALPAGLVLREVAFAWPDATERLYGRLLYPRIAALLGAVNGWLPVSLAELMLAAVPVAAAIWGVWRWRRGGPGAGVLRWAERLWILAGVALLAFLGLWGLNYARPGLAERLQLIREPVRARELLELGRGLAVETAAAWDELDADPEAPTAPGLSTPELDALVDAGFRRLELPGLAVTGEPSPAKPLMLSPLLSRLGLSGVFVPFTGEPSVNADVPDASRPLVLAHEKAHQRGITDEGEAGLVAWMVCMDAAHPYLRYAARLYGASRLLAAAAAELPDEAAAAYRKMGPGPLTDLRAIREFWEAHRGVGSRAATRLNDAYLRSNRVPGGVHSYGRVVDLLVALERRRLGGGTDRPAPR